MVFVWVRVHTLHFQLLPPPTTTTREEQRCCVINSYKGWERNMKPPYLTVEFTGRIKRHYSQCSGRHNFRQVHSKNYVIIFQNFQNSTIVLRVGDGVVFRF